MEAFSSILNFKMTKPFFGLLQMTTKFIQIFTYVRIDIDSSDRKQAGTQVLLFSLHQAQLKTIFFLHFLTI